MFKKIAIEISKYYGQQAMSENEMHPRVEAFIEWMIDNIKEDQLEDFKKSIYKKFEWFPKISELEILKTGNLELKAELAWQRILNFSDAHDVLITDPYTFAAVNSYGSWKKFCEQRDHNREWCHKGFIHQYIMFRESKLEINPIPLPGYFHCTYGANFQGVKIDIIGDQDLGKKLLQQNSNIIEVKLKNINADHSIKQEKEKILSGYYE